MQRPRIAEGWRAATGVACLLALASTLGSMLAGCDTSPTSAVVTPTFTSAVTPTLLPHGEPHWGMPFRPGLMGNIGLPENHADSRLHDANDDTITDDTDNTKTFRLLKDDPGSDYASLDMGVLGAGGQPGSSDDVSDENALALASGRVLAVEKACNAVLIDHFNGWWVIYLHLDANRIWVHSGDTVAAGMPIGVPTVHVGGCEQSTSYQHTHFAFLYNPKWTTEPSINHYISMRGHLLCGHAVTDDGIDGVTLPAGTATPVPFGSNFVFTIPSTCPAERPMSNVVATTTSAGYRVLRGRVTGVRAQWGMPQVSGPADSAMNASINVASWQADTQGHPDNSMVIFTTATVQSDNTVQYSNQIDIGSNTSQLNVPISVGDLMSASIQLKDGTSDMWVLTLTNATQGKSDQTSAQISADEMYPTFDLGPWTSHTFANFSPVRYSQAQVRLADGTWTDLGALPYQRTEMHDGDVNGTLIAQASSVLNNTFTATRVNPTH